MATSVERINPQQAHAHMRADEKALLVCAYDSEEQFQQNRLEGAISLSAFASRVGTIPKEREIIFYCA
jgi:rhodanese-related sulfurtransferase